MPNTKALLALLALCTSATAQAQPQVTLTTTLGQIVLELHADKAPNTVENFLSYAKDGFYEGTVFHRVIDGFVAQGGGFDASLNKKPTQAPIENEGKACTGNGAYSIAMARTGDPHSATSQFYINLKDNAMLNHQGERFGYCGFGQVIEGQDVVDKIAKVTTGPAGPFPSDVPREAIVITQVKVTP